MLKKLICVLLPAAIISCAGTSGGNPAPANNAAAIPASGNPGAGESRGIPAAISQEIPPDLQPALEELAEMERSRGFVPGLGLAESNLRERSGDYAGAVLAIYKELAWAYSMGVGNVKQGTILEALYNLQKPNTIALFSEEARKQTELAAEAIFAFIDSRWEEAEKLIQPLYSNDAEADSYSRWMLLVCSLERDNTGKENRSAYGSMRSRYASFPEYWYRGAHAGMPNAGDYAERCINLSPDGPFAAECRSILSKTMGLNPTDALAVKTRFEIETLVRTAADQGRPELLADLFPLMGLPDNPSTLYAAGAMRALASENTFRAWFVREAEKAKGRLAERLQFISRG